MPNEETYTCRNCGGAKDGCWSCKNGMMTLDQHLEWSREDRKDRDDNAECNRRHERSGAYFGE